MFKKIGAPTKAQEESRKRYDELQERLVKRQVVKPPKKKPCQ